MRRARASAYLSVAAGGLAAISFASSHPAPALVWNGSPSAPVGLYWSMNRAPLRGAYALVEPSNPIAAFIDGRGYLPENTPLVKRVAALSGDEICRKGRAVFINESLVAEALLVDSRGREMPKWRGCFTLQSDEIFLLNDNKKSLDGRYFGATQKGNVIGLAIPIFVKE